MKKIFTLILLSIAIITYSQKLEKVKGSKNVTLSERVFKEITNIELHKNITLTLINGTENKLEIYADDNLHKIVESDFSNGNLSIMLTNKISSKKKLELTLHIKGTSLAQIILNDNSKLKNVDFIGVEDLVINLNDKSVADVLFKANSIVLNAKDHAKGEMSLKGKEITYNLQESAKLKTVNDFDNISVKSNQKSNIALVGKALNLEIEAKNSSKVKASNLRTENTNLIAVNSVSIYVNTSKELNINADSKSKIYVYGSAKINLISFKGTSSLFKKE